MNNNKNKYLIFNFSYANDKYNLQFFIVLIFNKTNSSLSYEIIDINYIFFTLKCNLQMLQ